MVLGAKFAAPFAAVRETEPRATRSERPLLKSIGYRPVVRVVNGPSIALRDNLLAVAASRAIA